MVKVKYVTMMVGCMSLSMYSADNKSVLRHKKAHSEDASIIARTLGLNVGNAKSDNEESDNSTIEHNSTVAATPMSSQLAFWSAADVDPVVAGLKALEKEGIDKLAQALDTAFNRSTIRLLAQRFALLAASDKESKNLPILSKAEQEALALAYFNLGVLVTAYDMSSAKKRTKAEKELAKKGGNNASLEDKLHHTFLINPCDPAILHELAQKEKKLREDRVREEKKNKDEKKQGIKK